MDAIKVILLIFCAPFLLNAQKTKFPKDTIFVKFEKKPDPNGWHKKFKGIYEDKPGILFNIKDSLGDMTLFYNYNNLIDTLPLSKLNDFKTLNLKEIEKKEIEWVEKKFKNFKYKPYSGSKNSTFKTFLIEVISKEKFVVYPVIWRNEGIID